MTSHPHSDRTAPPDDVTDRLLWTLAIDVAAAHRPGPDGTCTNLQCRGQQPGPCWARRTAQRAERHARRSRPTLDTPLPHLVGAARGRARVSSPAHRFTGWFTPTPPQAPLTGPAPTADAQRPGPRIHRRPPVAALAA
ncbi:hypothetical protein KBX50_20430 [Micromonospora sp. C51]|uniref:hypothetical protein n=1 Tax=Micromonospora sp. C51 TaxID=2824879 RepID=UPI001B36CA31|nr:hypothetical protein [Micromonospora sp. C51]